LIVLLLTVAPAAANEKSAALRAAAFNHAYSLDYDEAARTMDAAVAADPMDVAAERGRAVIPWLLISFQRGAVTVDDYLGSVSRQNLAMRAPPADLSSKFSQHIRRATQMAEAAVAAASRPLTGSRRPDHEQASAEAHYQLGAVVGLHASYIATVEGRIVGALAMARRAFNAHERVLELDRSRTEAGLVLGTYRYLVSALSIPIRMLAYMVGFGGGKELGIRMIEEAAATDGDAQPEARFALVLIYNRERRYDDALRTLEVLQRMYPKNRLLWLEAGATALRGGKPEQAERVLTEGLGRLGRDARPRMFGEEALWLQKRGAARIALGRLDEAERDLRTAVTLEARGWVAGRVHAELGKILDLRGDRRAARVEFLQAAAMAERDRDSIGAAAAKRWIDSGYAPGR